MIKTVHGRGYRFVAAVRDDGTSAGPTGRSSRRGARAFVEPSLGSAWPLIGRGRELEVLAEWFRSHDGRRRVPHRRRRGRQDRPRGEGPRARRGRRDAERSGERPPRGHDRSRSRPCRTCSPSTSPPRPARTTSTAGRSSTEPPRRCANGPGATPAPAVDDAISSTTLSGARRLSRADHTSVSPSSPCAPRAVLAVRPPGQGRAPPPRHRRAPAGRDHRDALCTASSVGRSWPSRWDASETRPWGTRASFASSWRPPARPRS